MGNNTSSIIPNKFLEKEIDRLDRIKAEKDAVDTKINSIEKEVCANTTSVYSWNKWFKGIVITVIGAVILIGGTIANLTFSNQALAEDVGGVKEDIVELSDTVDAVQTSQNELAETVNKAQKADTEKEAKRLKELESLLDKAIDRARNGDKPARRVRRARQE